MIKYTEVRTTFAEIPCEINLCFSISNCAGVCANCHSPELRTNIGKDLLANIADEIKKHRGISCICFLGEALKVKDSLTKWQKIVKYIHTYFPHLKVAIYSGRDNVEPEMWELFDYIKIGPYIEELGPLGSPNTNQRLYKIENNEKIDITNLFLRKEKL